MNEVLKINYEAEQPTVSARELHEALGISKRFSAWFEVNSKGFIAGQDFTSVLSGTVVNNGATREIQDYNISTEMAKHICLMSRTEKGMQCRQYFIDLEKAWNTPEQIMARALKMANHSIESLKGRCKFLGEQVVEQQQIITELQPKSSYTTYVPVTHHYPDRWRISIKSIEKNDDGDYDTADYYTTEEVYNRGI